MGACADSITSICRSACPGTRRRPGWQPPSGASSTYGWVLGGLTGDRTLGPPVCVVFEGWDASGKGGAIKRLVGRLGPRHVRVAQFAAPTRDEKRHHFLARFYAQLPSAAPGLLTVRARPRRGRGPSTLSTGHPSAHSGDMTGTANAGSTQVSVLVGSPVARVAPDATLHEVADALVAAGVGALVVSNGASDGAAGIVSERDIVGALAERRDPATTRASDVAHRALVWCDAQATMTEVATQMMERYVRHVLVEEDGRLIGIVSARDLLGAYASGDTD
jgi:CBS domain-containing protein